MPLTNTKLLASFLIFTTAVSVAGCTSVPAVSDREPSARLDYHASTELGNALRDLSMANPGASGVLLLSDPQEALTARVQLARQAQRTLDVQYYIWKGDLVGRHLLREVVQAADRGVRVRLLIDDLHGFGKGGRLALLNQHESISIRLFNPFNVRNRYALFRRGADTLANARRINHRMHNKTFTADNQVSVVGGRNIGDEYFGYHAKLNFRDLDVLLAGPAVDEISESFDHFWNSRWAYPVDSLYTGRNNDEALDALLAELVTSPRPTSDTPEYSNTWHKQLIWCPARVAYDPPDKLEDPAIGARNRKALRSVLGEAQQELIVESAYFVPGRQGVKALGELVTSGVRVRVLTNSLAGNDSALSHSGYAPYRKALIDAGVELFEIRTDAAVRSTHVSEGREDNEREARLGLHAKTILIDRRTLFIGTLNLDPRSLRINTEIGVVLTCPEFGERLHTVLAGDFAPESAWQLTLDDRRRLTWTGKTHGTLESFHRDPYSSFGRRMAAWFWARLPLESQL